MLVKTKAVAASILVVGAFGLYACGGGGGGGSSSSPTTVLDDTVMDKAMTDVGNYLPGCEGVSMTKSPATRLPTGLLNSILSHARSMAKAAKTASFAREVIDDYYDGDCPGHEGYYTRVGVHDSGTTTATVTYVDYCTVDDVSGVETTQDGVLKYVETGTPGDFGPIISKVTASTGSSGITVSDTDGMDETVTMTSMKYVYGVPGEAPTAADPDVLTISSFKLKNNNTNTTQTITGLNIDVHDNLETGVINVNSLTLTNSEGRVSLETSSPLVVDGGEVVEGALLVTGKNDTTAELTIADPGIFTITVNGNAFDQQLDCSNLGF